MLTRKIRLWTSVVLLHLSFPGFSQVSKPEPERNNWFRLGFNLAAQASFCKFIKDDLMYGGLRITPLPSYSLGLSYHKVLSSRFALEGGLYVTSVGVRMVFMDNYPGSNIYEGKGVNISTSGAFSIPFSFKYTIRKKPKNIRTYFKLGTTILSLPNFGGGKITTSDQNSSLVRYESSKLYPCLSVGIGKEKIYKNAMMLSYGIIFNQGFAYIQDGWEYTLTVNKTTYKNQVGIKGTYIGLEAKLFFQPWGYKRYKRAVEKFNTTQ